MKEQAETATNLLLDFANVARAADLGKPCAPESLFQISEGVVKSIAAGDYVALENVAIWSAELASKPMRGGENMRFAVLREVCWIACVVAKQP